MRVKFTVLGEPRGKERPRCAKYSKHPITPEQTVLYENLIKTEYRRQCGDKQFPQGQAITVLIYAFYSIPKSASKKKQAMMRSGEIRPTKKPDYDNIGKVVCDSLNGIAYHDDAQAVDGLVRKFYSDKPRVCVIIEEAEFNPELFEKIMSI